MVPDFHGPRRHDALGAVEGGERLRELGHAAADGGQALHEHHLVSGPGDVEGHLHARDPRADDEDAAPRPVPLVQVSR